MKKLLCLIISTVIVLGLISCGNRNNPGNSGSSETKKPNATKIVVYVGGSSEYNTVEGTKEEEVIDAIEDAYYNSTGIVLDFEVSYLGSNMKSKLSSTIASNGQVDLVVSHTRYGSGIDEYSIDNKIYYELSDKIDAYGSNIDKYTNLDTMRTFSGDIVGIPSNINPYKYGILVRKDYMNAVGYTDNAEEAAQNSKLTLLTNLKQFTDMCKKMKLKEITGLNNDSAYSITGGIWDVEKVFAGAFTNAGYFSYKEVVNENGDLTSLVPGFATTEYQELLQQEYDWVNNDKILYSNANGMSLESAESEFISGKTGVFITNPSIDHYITVSRQCKNVNPSAVFTVLGALPKDENSNQKGFIRATSAYKAAVIMKNSQNAEAIIKFINWSYANADNYNLCRYGVEGTHWINNKDGTYSYPNENYVTSSPYSGVLCFVENNDISNLKYLGLTQTEKNWFEIASDKNNYVDNDTIDYIMPKNDSMGTIALNAKNNYYSSIAVPAWSGSSNPSTIIDGQKKSQLYLKEYLTNAKEYLEWITQNYKLMKSSRG